MREDRLPKKFSEWQPMGRRKSRPTITWTEGILKEMRERGIQGDREELRRIGYRKMSKML
ncbi:hypothetical protein C0J52_06517 [Blattella germanica]|nr:hypothetical protein C0J52_06517 [Blattella germanica]